MEKPGQRLSEGEATIVGGDTGVGDEGQCGVGLRGPTCPSQVGLRGGPSHMGETPKTVRDSRSQKPVLRNASRQPDEVSLMVIGRLRESVGDDRGQAVVESAGQARGGLAITRAIKNR
jgi:hypothetical protein